MPFDHEKFEVYQAALRFTAFAVRLCDEMPAIRGRGALVDQLTRASFSIALNIAEGAGRAAPKDKRHFYLIASGSTSECAAILDVVAIATKTSLDEEADVAEGKEMLVRVASMLAKLQRSLEDRMRERERE